MSITSRPLSGRRWWLLLVGCLAATAAACATPSPTALPALHPDIDHLDETAVTVTTTAGRDVEVGAKVAATAAARRHGLMEVTQLPPGTGMLFLFDGPVDGGFWMWNTLIELDIAFVGDDGTIHTVATMVPCGEQDPAACPTTAPDAPYVAALEVPGGWFAEVGVTPGATMSWTDPTPIRS